MTPDETTATTGVTNIPEASAYGIRFSSITYGGGTDNPKKVAKNLGLTQQDKITATRDAIILLDIGNDITFAYFPFSNVIEAIDIYESVTTETEEYQTKLTYTVENTIGDYGVFIEEDWQDHIKTPVESEDGQRYWDSWYQSVHSTAMGDSEMTSKTDLDEIARAGIFLITNEYQLP